MPENKEEWVDCVAIEAMKAFIVSPVEFHPAMDKEQRKAFPVTFANICYTFAEAMYERSQKVK